jgi:hypothetical protein
MSPMSISRRLTNRDRPLSPRLAHRDASAPPPLGARSVVGERRLRAEQPYTAPAVEGFVPDGTLIVYLAAQADDQAGEMDVAYRVQFSSGFLVGLFRERFRLRGNRLHFLGRLADLAREHAAVRADYPVRVICTVDDP